MDPIPNEPRQRKPRTAVEKGREEAATATRKRAVTFSGKSKASTSKVRLSSPEPSDPEPEADRPSELEEEAESEKEPEIVPVQPAVPKPKIVLSSVPKTPVVINNPLPPKKPKMSGGFRKPWAWESNSPSFDGKTASSLKRFLRHCKAIVREAGITDADEQKTCLLDYINKDNIREQFEKLSTYAGGTFDEWCRDIESLYPEIEDMGTGSLEMLTNLCKEARAKGLTQNDLGAIRRFKVSFSSEAEKLLRPPASVTNKTLVDLILETLDRGFANSVESILNQKLVMDNTAAVTAPAHPAQPAQAAGVAPVAGPMAVARRGDRLDYKSVLEIAEKIADNWSGRGSSLLLAGVSSVLHGGERSAASLLQGESMTSLQKEVTDKLDMFSGELASLKDSAVVQEKQFKESLERMENALKESITSTLVQYTRGQAGQPPQQSGYPGPRQETDRPYVRDARESNTGSTRSYLCYFCLGPHLIRDCAVREEYIRMGRLKVENNRMYYGDGSGILVPRYPEWKSRKDHIDEYYASKGQNNVPGRTVNLMQGQGGYFNQYSDDDSLEHLYDTRADERLSHQVQMNMLNEAYRTQMRQASQPAMMPQNVGNVPTASQPGVCNITTEGLAQLLNMVNPRNVVDNGRSNENAGSQEQLLNTRSGRTVQGAPAPSF